MAHRRLRRHLVWLGAFLLITACEAGTSTVSSSSPPVDLYPEGSGIATEVALVVGDFGTGGPDQEQVAAAMEATAGAEKADWFITTGDNFYTDDVEEVWTDPFGWVIAGRIGVVATLGNHDVETSDRRELVTNRLDIERPWYRTEIGPVVVLALDSTQVTAEEQTEWLETALARAEEELVVVVFHHPAYSCSQHGGHPAVVEHWVPLFEEHDVDLVLNGHDHNYQRRLVAGITYVVTGGGGAGLYPIESCPSGSEPPVAANDSQHHYLVVTMGSKGIAAKALAVGGNVIDRFSVTP